MADDQRLYELARIAQHKTIRQRQRTAKARMKATSHPTIAFDAAPNYCDGPELQAVSPSQLAGRRAEDQALLHVQQDGLTILARNLRSKTGEIDLIAVDGTTLVFIEVRQRRSNQYGGAAASVNRQKQARLLRTAQFFLPRLAERYFRGVMPVCRFDVISVEPEGLVWIKNAFSA